MGKFQKPSKVSGHLFWVTLLTVVLMTTAGAMTDQSRPIQEISDGDFQSLILDDTSGSVTLVDFWAPWCGPCRAMSPVLADLSTRVSPDVKIYKINLDQNKDISKRYHVRGIPTIIFFKNGVEISRTVGTQTSGKLFILVEDLRTR